MTSPEKLMRYAWGYAPPLIIEAALTNGVFDALDGGPKTIAETAAATGASKRGLSAVMNALIGLEMLERDSAGRFSLTPEAAAFLVSSKPSYLGGFIKYTRTRMIPNWLNLAEIVRTGQPASRVNEEEDGVAFFSDLVEDLFPMNYVGATAAAEILGISGSQKPLRVLDLAAGSGVWSIAMAQKSPHVTVTAVDWPPVLEITRKTTRRFGLEDRYTFVPGDLETADFGTGHNIAILGHILHSEGLKKSRSLLAKTFDALAPGGTVVVGEFLVDADRRGPVQNLIFGVNMLVNTTHGTTFSFEEIAEWLEICGFTGVRTVPAPGPSPLIFADRKV